MESLTRTPLWPPCTAPSRTDTSDVATSLRRLTSFFPSEEQAQARERLADQVQAIISLRLLPNKQGTGRVPAVEVMRTTRMIRECMRDPQRIIEIADHIAKGREDLRMQTFD